MDMINKCIQCGADIHYEPAGNILNVGLGSIKPTICSDQCEAQNREERQAIANKNLFYRIIKVVPETYKGIKLSWFDEMELKHVQTGKVKPAFEILKNFCNSDYWNITLGSEGNGNGKTSFALYIMASLALKGIYRTKDIATAADAGYFSAIDISKILKTESYDQKQYKLKSFYNSRVLIIDDLGQEKKFDSEEIASIIKVREENNRKTIITTNIGPAEMEERYTKRIHSRIQRGIFHVTGGDKRS